MKVTALIMAGGRGERFWPKSRKHMPKQFLSLTGDGKTMIQLTVERILPLVAMEDIYISTNQDYKPLVQQQLPDIPEQNIICEPGKPQHSSLHWLGRCAYCQKRTGCHYAGAAKRSSGEI